MVEECHRLGVKTITHARGKEAVLYSARAGVDVIFHGFEMDDEGLEEVVKNGSILSPALTFLFNTVEFTRPGDPLFQVASQHEQERRRDSQRNAGQGTKGRSSLHGWHGFRVRCHTLWRVART